MSADMSRERMNSDRVMSRLHTRTTIGMRYYVVCFGLRFPCVALNFESLDFSKWLSIAARCGEVEFVILSAQIGAPGTKYTTKASLQNVQNV